MCKTTISQLPERYLSIEGLVVSGASILVGMVWKGKFRISAIKWFMVFAITESVCGFCLGIYCVFHWNVWIFSIFKLIYVSFVSLTISKCIMSFESKLWNNKVREDFDNSRGIIYDIASGIGLTISSIYVPSLNLALFLWACGCIIDDIGWILLYGRTREILIKDIDNESQKSNN